MTKLETPSQTEKTSGCCDWKKCVDDFTASAGKMTREKPGKAVGLAFVAGLLCTILPVGRLIGGLIRLAVALIPPALLVLGGIKLWEEIEKRADK